MIFLFSIFAHLGFAEFNETCNALDLAVVCENECNTYLNVCVLAANGDVNKVEVETAHKK
jgi:hypothetical protein